MEPAPGGPCVTGGRGGRYQKGAGQPHGEGCIFLSALPGTHPGVRLSEPTRLHVPSGAHGAERALMARRPHPAAVPLLLRTALRCDGL